MFRVQAVHIYGALADLALRQGNLHDAAANWKKALNAIQNSRNRGTYPLPLIGWVYVRMGELLYEQNDLSRAWEHIARGLDYAEAGGDVKTMLAGYLIAGRLKLSEADIDGAAIYLEKARHHIETSQFAHWISQFERLQLELWLEQDKLRAAVNWSDKLLADTQFAERPENEIAQLAIARVLITRGDKPAIERSLSLLEGLLQIAEDEGRTGIKIEGLALQTIAYWQQGKRAEALIHLERTLRLAEPEGYVRLFVDMGLSMARLLQEASTRDVMPDYVTELLGAFEYDFELSPEQVLPEPLTSREQDVLQLMAVGLTNAEIAEELVIAAGTVKKHAANIYGKLDVSNRTEAAKKARDLDLLNPD
jgi:LuxR family maltose regulon positive regulatory protein